MSGQEPIIVNGFPHKYYVGTQYDHSSSFARSEEFYQTLNLRRSIREFSSEQVPKSVIENLVMAAASAPSGAHKQPWHFVCVSNQELKSKIRVAAEEEEFESYNSRMSERWLKDLQPIGTDWKKPFLEEAPWLIIVFKKVYELDAHGTKANNYYVNESVGIACGMLIAAIHVAGLVTLTHTPSPMNFLSKILNRPENERPFLLLPVGFPKDKTTVPDFQRKSKTEISEFL
jgi:iodotyrosine deiodinase